MFPPRHNDPYRRGQQQQQLTRLPEMSELSRTIVNGAQSFGRRHTYITGFYLLGVCVLGLLILTGGRGRTMNAQQVQQYNYIMNNINVEQEYEAEMAVYQYRQRYQASRGWFWNCDSTCTRYRNQFKSAESHLLSIRQSTSTQIRQAKAVAGVTSDMAVSEIQDSFWSYFTAGKRSAQRRTMWDIMWLVIRGAMGAGRGREEGMAEYIVRILMHLLVNFTVGLVMALLMFLFSLWSIVYSYQPNPIVAVLIFLAAAAAGFAFVATYLLAMAGATFGGVYGVAKLAEASARQQRIQGGQQYQRPRVHYD
jgi:hypothetical protein